MSYEELLEQSAFKNEGEITPEEAEVWRYERARCQMSFLHFLKWVKVLNPPIPGETREAIVPLEMWEHTKKVVATLLTKNLISVLKARQIGLSTILAAYAIWYALAKPAASIFLFSQGQNEAKELLLKCRTVYDYLPTFMKFPVDPDSSEALGFPVMKSIIRALPSTPSAGIGYTASLIIWDEHAKHEYASQNYIHAKPIIDRGAQAISVFTADPLGNDNLATQIYLDSKEDANGYVHLFFPYDVVPNRGDEWYQKTKKSIPTLELAKLSPELYMSKNYPSSEDEALSLAENVAVFDKNILNIMREDLRSKINYNWEDIDEHCSIYRDYHFGESYVAGCDVGQGVSGDYSAFGIMDSDGRIVADILTNDIPPEEFAYYCYQLLTHYRNPYVWVENNFTGGGREVIRKLVELGYRKLGFRGAKTPKWSDIGNSEVIKSVGFFTDEKSRADLFGQFIAAINDHLVTIYNQKGLDQFTTIIRNMNKNGKIEASSGRHDDYVIMAGICWLKRQEKKEAERVKAVETLTFKKEHPPVIERLLQGV